MQRLAVLVPRRRLHWIRVHSVLAPNAKLRSADVPGKVEEVGERACDHAQRPARVSWAWLLKRTMTDGCETFCGN